MNMRKRRGCRFGRWAVGAGVLSLATVLGACSTSTPAPDHMARTAADTAPADIQLLCATAAAGGGGGNVLPVTSRRIDATTYQVDLNVAGSTRTCIIDAGGNVLSMQQGTG
ncbi:hypothetical protein [Mesorhizobium sp. CAU 1732]|uniref:hypothetical protein n=1 Tax=Mesorhizobium sp. CAU 1732 TaxID=3140358 RepID=UPI0032614BCD